MLQCILIVAAIAALFYYFAIKPMSYWKNRGVKQGNPVWLLGDQWGPALRCKSFAEMIQSVYNAVPDVRYSGIYQFTTPILLVRDIELIKQIGVKDFDHFTDHRSIIPETGEPLWAKNLFSLKGKRWRDMRPILSPSFTSSKMKLMFVLMSECAETFTNFYLKKDQNSIEIEMKETCTRYTNDVIATTAFGIKVNSLENQNNEFYLMGKEVTSITGVLKTIKIFGNMFMPKLYEFLNIGFFSNRVRKFFINLVEETMKIREEKGIVRPDMINLLMEAKKGIYDKDRDNSVIDSGFAVAKEADLGKGAIKDLTTIDMAAQALVFFFGGFDTTSGLMCFMAYELAANPDIQKRLREEIETTYEQCNGKLTYEALLKMEYMDMVVSETLRKWPGGLIADRVCTKPYTIQTATPEEKPLHLDVGDMVWIATYGIHRDPQYYSKPEQFDPERFNEENKDKINPYTFLPFGIGPRNCIGSRFAILETKTLFFYLLLRFEIVPNARTTIPLKLSRKQISLASEGGFWFDFKRINK